MKHENPNSHTGHMYSHPDSERLRFTCRGRTDPGVPGPPEYAERLRDQVENGKVHEMAISPDIKAGSVIEPSQEPGRAWLKGLEFGGEE